MAFRDTWHRSLVYFGLAEERDPDYDDGYADDPGFDPEPEERPVHRERPSVRRMSAASSRRRRDDFDDIFAYDDLPSSSDRGTRVLRSVGARNGRSGGDVTVH